MKKRILSMFLVVSMLLSLLPVTASAADSVTVTVGAVELSDGQYTSDGVSITETPGDSYAYLKDGVLTLHNFTYEGDGKGGTTTSNPIRMLGSSADLVIALEGTNAFVMNASGSNYRCGLFCGRDLQITITSTTMGSLSLVSASANQISSGVHNYYGTVIVSGNAVVSASGTTVGIYGALTVSGGGVIAQGASGAFSKEPVLDNYSPVVKAGTDAQSAETAELGSCYKQPYVSILPAAAPDPEPETPEAPDAPAEGVGYTIDHSAEKLYAQDGYEISADHETWDKELDAAPGGTYYVRVAQSGNVPASEGTAFQLTLRPSAPAAQVAVTSNMVALEEDAAWEYSSDGVNWGSSAMFEGLREASPYTFYVRTKATEENFASEPAVISVYTAAAPPAPGTGYAIDYAAEWLFAQEGYLISEDAETWGESFKAIPGATYYVRREAQADVPASEAVAFTVSERPAAPDEPCVEDWENTTITITADAELEYCLDGGEWVSTTANSYEFTDLEPGKTYTLQARTKATDTTFVGEITYTTVKTKRAAYDPDLSGIIVTEESITFPEGEPWWYLATEKDGWREVKYPLTTQLYLNEQIYTLKVKVAETKDAMESNVATLVLCTPFDTPVEKEGYEIDYAAESLSVLEGFEISLDGNVWLREADLLSGQIYFVRRAAQGLNAPSQSVSFRTPERPGAPDCAVVEARGSDSVTIRVEKDLQYRLNNGQWIAPEGEQYTFNGLNAGTEYSLQVRVAPMQDSFASLPAESRVSTLAAAAAAPEVQVVLVRADTIELEENAAWEYSTDGVNWSKGHVFENLSPATEYTYFVRVEGSEDALPSQVTQLHVFTAYATPGTGEGYEIDYSGETLTLEEGYEISRDGTEWSLSAIFIPGETYSIRKAAMDKIPASEPTFFTLAPRPAAPACSAVDESTQGKADGSLTGITAQMEYCINSGAWQSGPAELTALAGGTEIQVRVRATETAPCSVSATYTIAVGGTLSVHFDAACGEDPQPLTNLVYGQKIAAPTVPEKAGYQFEGWYFGGAKWDFDADTVTQSVTLTASWKAIEYAITYDLAGGTGENPESYTIETESFELTTPTREGYTFAGWTGTDFDEPTAEVTIAKGSTGARRYTANWKAIEYTITYDLAGGSGENPKSYTVETETFELTAPTREGYTFAGWTGTDFDEPTAEVTIVKGSTGARSYTAAWEAVEYVITYDLAGGVAENPESYTIETETFQLTAPTREGYTFAGWTGTDLDEPTAEVTIVKGSTGARRYTANWKAIEYTITYDLAGGSGENPESYTIESETFELTVPTREGYTFLGWTGDGFYSPSKYVRIPKGSSGSRSYTAHWSATEYTISYDLAGGAVSGNAARYTVESEDFTLVNPSKDGYVFAGWVGTGLEQATKTVFIAKGSTGNRTYTATWKAIVYTISYDLAGGKADNPKDYTIESVAFELNPPTREGYTFVGWTGTDLYSPSKTVKIPDGSTGNRAYTATWEPVEYTIEYVLNGGKADNPKYYTAETDEIVLIAPGRDGYAFDGWIGTDYPEKTMEVSIPRGSLGDRTYEAKWKAIEYKLSYDLAGGSLEETNPAGYTVESADLILKKPHRNGYTFAGWIGTDLLGASETVLIEQGSTGDRSYTATWTATAYNIFYQLNGGSAENPTSYTIETPDFFLEKPTKRGYTFAGWTGTGLQETVQLVSILQGSTGVRMYTATWTVNGYGISYDLAGGNISGNPAIYTTEDEDIVLANPTREGYAFVGWTGTGLTQPTMRVTIPKGSIGERTYKANWIAVEYTIHCDLADGEGGENTQVYTIESESFILINPTREHYVFQGWIGTGLEAASLQVQITKGSTGDRSYTAVWAPREYEIRYELDDGRAEGNPASYTVESDEFSLVNPTRAGYTFAGWTGTDLDAPEMTVVVPQGSSGVRNYTATWTPIEYTLSYDLNGGEAEGNPQIYTVESLAFTLVNPERKGYVFAGWIGTDLQEPTITLTVSQGSLGHRSYTAVWTVVEYPISYELNGGAAEGNPTSYTVESPDFTLQNPEKLGYTFAGWIGTACDEATQIVTVRAGSMGTRSYTATWIVDGYTISYDLAGGSVSGNPAAYTAESETITLQNPSRTGYTFLGWTGTDLVGTVKQVTIPSGSIGDRVYTAVWSLDTYQIDYEDCGETENPTNYSVESQTFTLINPVREGYEFLGWTGTGLDERTLLVTIPKGSIGERTYTAHWATNGYRIDYDLAGGSVAGNPTTYHVETADFILNNPAREGYTFAGWTGTDLSEPSLTVTIEKGSMGNRSYTATWTPVTYTIRYDLAGGTGENPQSYTVETHSFELTAPTREGYAFVGWTGTDLSEATAQVVIPEGSMGDRAYQAVWKVKEYFITYHLNGGNVSGNPAVYTTETEDLVLVNPTREGYVFAGWIGTDLSEATLTVTIQKGSTGEREYTATWEAGDETPYQVEHWLQNLDGDGFTCREVQHLTGTTNAEITPEVKAYPGFTAPAVQQVVIKADGSLVVRYEYTRNCYSVKHSYEGPVPTDAPNAPETKEVWFEQTVTVSSAPEQLGYTFSGWTTQDAAVADGVFRMPANEVHFVGAWRANSFAVHFNAVGGIGEMEDQQFVYDVRQPLNENAFTKAGYSFVGWAETATGETVYADGDEVMNLSAVDGAVIELYAVWRRTAPVVIPPAPPTVTPPAQPDADEQTHTCSACAICGLCLDKACDKACAGHKEHFTDVPQQQWYSEAVEYVCTRGLMQGMGEDTFRPAATTSRAMLAAILWRLEGMPEPTKEHSFRDVDNGGWYAKAVAWAAEKELVFGTTLETFSPNGEITREQMAALLWRYVRYRGETADDQKSLDAFHDADEVSAYAADALEWAHSLGLISGKTGGRLDPRGDAKRCEMASILMRFLKEYGY